MAHKAQKPGTIKVFIPDALCAAGKLSGCIRIPALFHSGVYPKGA